ncbi:TnsA endonuclease N-terminal domain-containing protein [Gloeothece verrucosa]|uniref:TnsA endonuclease N-terminal domain-containing protein n=1 Tax=Gloeothece verrucosa TaxID=2546359 RepID=UPI00017E2409|nr:TnsA endonuclease N-terminal domain-containing protein [Gloeothece verrucosa]
MNDQQFTDWCQKLKLPSPTVELIKSIRSSPPSRRVQGRAGNVSGVYPSRKMGHTVSFESAKVELWAIYQMEHDKDVLEFYDQPEGFKIKYQNAAGRTIGHYHTPDFFVLRSSHAAWEEWKTEKQLINLSEKYPTRYQKTELGVWRCPPGEEFASLLGLKYYVRSDASLNPIYIQNLIFLEDYLKFTVSVSREIQTQVKTIIQDNQGITLTQILSNLEEVRANDLYKMIALEQIYVDLSAIPLVNGAEVRLYSDKTSHETVISSRLASNSLLPISSMLLSANTQLDWDGKFWTLINQGQTTTTLLPENGQPVKLNNEIFQNLLLSGSITKRYPNLSENNQQKIRELISQASAKDLEIANHRNLAVQAYLERNKNFEKNFSERTVRKWVKKFREADVELGCGYVGLLPLTKKRGNRLPKANNQALSLLDSFIAQHFETSRQAPAASVYRAYQRACSTAQITALSRTTFYKRIKERGSPEHLRKRYGAKVAYQVSPWYWELNASTPRHGDRPLSVAHLDHTQLDIELRSSTTGRLLGRPWLTLLTDAYSRRILAIYLTFDSPSYRSCMMVLRICVGRTGRFPESLVVDGGKEFHSVYFDSLLARYHCLKKTRPAHQPRFGSVIERLFDTTNTQFVYNLLGNTQASKQPRTLTKDINPKQQAVWTLSDLYTYLQQWEGRAL